MCPTNLAEGLVASLWPLAAANVFNFDPSSNTWFHGPTRVSNPNGIWMRRNNLKIVIDETEIYDWLCWARAPCWSFTQWIFSLIINSSSVMSRVVITDCLLHAPFHRRWRDIFMIFGRCCLHVERSASARHLGNLSTSPESKSRDLSLLSVLPPWL